MNTVKQHLIALLVKQIL